MRIITTNQFSVGAESPDGGQFAIGAGEFAVPSGIFNEFIQWRDSGADLGNRKVRIVDFVDPGGTKMVVTRGVGENSHVITVRFIQQVLYFTSWPYPVEVTEPLALGLAVPLGGYLLGPNDENMQAELALPVSGTLISVLNVYADALAEPIDLGLAIPQSGTLVSIVQLYNNALPEPIDLGLAIPQSGTLDVVLISYLNWPEEPIDLGLAIPQSGTLV